MFTKAMIIDDNTLDRKILGNLLHSLEILVLECSDAFDALEQLEKTPIDLIFLDINMPGLNGFKLLQRIRRFCDRNSIPILMMSGTHLDKSDVLRTLKSGASDFLVKPITIEILEEKYVLLKQNDRISKHTRVELPQSSSTLSTAIDLVTLDPHGIVAVSNAEILQDTNFLLNNPFLNKYGINDLPVTLKRIAFAEGKYLIYLAFGNISVDTRSRLRKLYNSLVEQFKVVKEQGI